MKTKKKQIRCIRCNWFASADQVVKKEFKTPTIDGEEDAFYYEHKEDCSISDRWWPNPYYRQDKKRKPKCPKCRHGKAVGHNGRSCIATVVYRGFDYTEYDWCGCTYDARKEEQTSGAPL